MPTKKQQAKLATFKPDGVGRYAKAKRLLQGAAMYYDRRVYGRSLKLMWPRWVSLPDSERLEKLADRVSENGDGEIRFTFYDVRFGREAYLRTPK